jgi:hypothetical protein
MAVLIRCMVVSTGPLDMEPYLYILLEGGPWVAV